MAAHFEQLRNTQLAQVWFVRDYLMLIFEGDRTFAWSCLTWPTITSGSTTLQVGESGYRDALCAFIDSDVGSVEESASAGLRVTFANGSFTLRPLSHEVIGPEIAMLTSDGDMTVWRFGEDIFSYLSAGVDYERFVESFGSDPGVLPDGKVLGATQEDWGAVFATLRSSGWEVRVGPDKLPLPAGSADPPLGVDFTVWPTPAVQINFFYNPEGVFFDIDLREFVNQAAGDALTDLMRSLGTSTGKDVVILYEGSEGPPILHYKVESDEFVLLGPEPRGRRARLAHWRWPR